MIGLYLFAMDWVVVMLVLVVVGGHRTNFLGNRFRIVSPGKQKTFDGLTA